jgi:elongation factor Ts
MSTLKQIKELREKTGAGIVEVKKALQESEGDQEKAIEILRKKGQDKALKKSDREAKEGIIGYYVHSNEKVAAMIKVFCETDFVARNEEFQLFAKDIAMHITAMNPQYLSPEDVSEELVVKEREIWKEQLASEGKPENIMSKIMEGKEKKFRAEVALLTQPFVKNPEITVEQLLTDTIAKIGENIQLGEFVRFEL